MITIEEFEELVAKFDRAALKMGKMALSMPSAEVCFEVSKQRGDSRKALIAAFRELVKHVETSQENRDRH